jgi:hypothetical protein
MSWPSEHPYLFVLILLVLIDAVYAVVRQIISNR